MDLLKIYGASDELKNWLGDQTAFMKFALSRAIEVTSLQQALIF